MESASIFLFHPRKDLPKPIPFLFNSGRIFLAFQKYQSYYRFQFVHIFPNPLPESRKSGKMLPTDFRNFIVPRFLEQSMEALQRFSRFQRALSLEDILAEKKIQDIPKTENHPSFRSTPLAHIGKVQVSAEAPRWQSPSFRLHRIRTVSGIPCQIKKGPVFLGPSSTAVSVIRADPPDDSEGSSVCGSRRPERKISFPSSAGPDTNHRISRSESASRAIGRRMPSWPTVSIRRGSRPTTRKARS